MIAEVVPVEEVKKGQEIRLPNSGMPVTVESVTEEDGRYELAWWRPAARGEPGYGPDLDGRYLGTFRDLPAGSPIRLA